MSISGDLAHLLSPRHLLVNTLGNSLSSLDFFWCGIESVSNPPVGLDVSQSLRCHHEASVGNSCHLSGTSTKETTNDCSRSASHQSSKTSSKNGSRTESFQPYSHTLGGCG